MQPPEQRDDTDPVVEPDQQPTEASHPAIRDGGQAAMPRLSQLGPYRIERALGWGGMGIVYAAEDTRSGERVALKLLRFSDPGGKSLRRFQQEAEATRRLHHPNIVGLREIGREQDYDFYTMDLVEGRDLGDWIRHDKPPLEAVVRVLAKVARAVDHAHRRQLLHRDLKPSNIIIDRSGEPFVTDFGLARAIGAESSLTASDQAVGTPQYMSPEQARGLHQDCGPQSDVWSLGIMLYEALAGRQPFQGESVLDIMQAVVTQEVPLPRRFRPEVSPPLERVVMQCLEKQAEHRYPSAEALAEDLERWLTGATVLARRYSTWTRALRWTRIKWKAIGVAALLLVSLGVAIWALSRERGFDPGRWVLAWDWNCLEQTPQAAGVSLVHGHADTVIEDWPRGDFGVKPQRAVWCWLDPIQVSGDVRLELTVRTRDHLDGIELALSSQRQEPTVWSHVPRGYSCQFSGYAGSLCFISRNERQMTASYAYGRASPLREEQEYQLAFCRVGERLWLEVDGEEILSADYALPMVGEGMEQLGFRSYSFDLELLGVKVYRLAGAIATDPLAIPDAALQLGRFDQAIDGYEAIAAGYDGEPAARALGRAYLASLQLGTIAPERQAALRQRLFAEHGDSPSALTALEAEAALAWDDEDFAAAFELIERCFEQDRETQVMYRILELREPPPLDRVEAYLRYLGRTRDLRSLHLQTLEIGDLTPLQDLELEWLELDRNRISDLSPLSGMPLVWLRLGYNRIESLAPLRGMPLRWLSFPHNPVRDLAPLRGAPLTSLDLSHTQVRDLSALKGMPLRNFQVQGLDPLPSLAPLAQAPLRNLNISASEATVVDLSGFDTRRLQRAFFKNVQLRNLDRLQQAPLFELSLDSLGLERLPDVLSPLLTNLDCRGNRLVDLTPLRGTALTELRVSDNRVVDLEPLRELPLYVLECSDNLVTDCSPLAGMPLQRLVAYANPLRSEGMDAVAAVPQLRLGDLQPELQGEGSQMAETELAALIARWSDRPELARQVEALRNLLAWRRGDVAALRAQARQAPGARWGLLPVWGHPELAERLATGLGARLMTAEEAAAWNASEAQPRGNPVWLAGETTLPEQWDCLHGDGRLGRTWYWSWCALFLVWDD